MKKYLLLTLFGFISAALSGQVKFSYQHKKGDSGSYISTAEEDVYYNGYLNHHSEIINRVSHTITNTATDGEAFIYATYMTTNNSITEHTGRLLSWGEESTSVFARKTNGELTISDDIFMPTVRNVPVFPDKKVKIGESWTATGKEVQDVRKAFNMEKALVYPFTATYTYKGDTEENGKKLNIIEVVYDLQCETDEQMWESGSTLAASSGKSTQILYWDNKKGVLDHKDDSFEIQIQDIYGNIYTFTGTAHEELTEYHSLNNAEAVAQIQETVDKLKLENISVKKGEKGLTISMENIQFEPDSNILLDSEKVKLQKLSQILNQYSNDLLVTGHCANRGTARARQQLSEERAEAVASYLEELGVRDEYHIFTQGKGATEPIATNNTEEGRAKNRRVEITIMD